MEVGWTEVPPEGKKSVQSPERADDFGKLESVLLVVPV